MNPPLTTELAEAASDLKSVQAQLEEIVTASVRVQVAQENLERAQALAGDHLADSKVRFLLLRLKEAAGLNEGMAEQWATLLEECPDDFQIVRYCATRLVKERKIDEALSLVDRHLPPSTQNPDRLFSRAKLLSDIRAHEQSDALFRRLISENTDRNMRVEFAKRLRKRGLLADAFDAIAPAVSAVWAALLATLSAACSAFLPHPARLSASAAVDAIRKCLYILSLLRGGL